MTWIKFALWMGAIYLIYYALMILWDYLRSGRQPAAENAHELSFEEHVEPVREIPDGSAEIYDASVLSSGGVSLKQLFNLAREEVIEYTRPVSY
jgi:arginine exporter protein ArgO